MVAWIPDGVLRWWRPGCPSFSAPRHRRGQEVFHHDNQAVLAPKTLDGRVQAPHLAIRVSQAKASKRSTLTRLCLEDEADAAGDPILNLVQARRRPTLIARPTGKPQVPVRCGDAGRERNGILRHLMTASLLLRTLLRPCSTSRSRWRSEEAESGRRPRIVSSGHWSGGSSRVV